jgi:hypothetical protein
MAVNLLTPTTLRWSTLSATSRKEGKKNFQTRLVAVAQPRQLFS